MTSRYNADNIVMQLQERARLRRAELRRVRLLTREELDRERAELSRARDVARPFIDDEAEESDYDGESDAIAEVGYRNAFDDVLPTDSHFTPYVRLVGKRGRLFKITSKEFLELPRGDRRHIFHGTKVHDRIVRTQG